MIVAMGVSVESGVGNGVTVNVCVRVGRGVGDGFVVAVKVGLAVGVIVDSIDGKGLVHEDNTMVISASKKYFFKDHLLF